MKPLEEIKRIPGILIAETAEDGGRGVIFGLDTKKPNTTATVVWSIGRGWDHVSVAFGRRCPTWEEMDRVKNWFFGPDAWVIQYHPPKEQNISLHPYCLHMWRPQEVVLPVPPYWMVGPKKGQSLRELAEDIRQTT